MCFKNEELGRENLRSKERNPEVINRIEYRVKLV
jgi:hypothetical protein